MRSHNSWIAVDPSPSPDSSNPASAHLFAPSSHGSSALAVDNNYWKHSPSMLTKASETTPQINWTRAYKALQRRD